MFEDEIEDFDDMYLEVFVEMLNEDFVECDIDEIDI